MNKGEIKANIDILRKELKLLQKPENHNELTIVKVDLINNAVERLRMNKQLYPIRPYEIENMIDGLLRKIDDTEKQLLGGKNEEQNYS
jgi:hypothetical protein